MLTAQNLFHDHLGRGLIELSAAVDGDIRIVEDHHRNFRVIRRRTETAPTEADVLSANETAATEAELTTPEALEEESLLDELAEICEAVEIESASAFTFAGHRLDVSAGPAFSRASSLPGSERPYQEQNPTPLINRLQQVLYGHGYSRRFDLEDLPDFATSASASIQVPGSSSFVQRLVAAVGGGGHMGRAWRVVAVDPRGWVTAFKSGLMRVFPLAYVKPMGALRLGGKVSIESPKAFVNQQEGCFYIHSETLGEVWTPYEVLGIYWNLTSEEAPDRIGTLVRRLDRFQVPFQLKTLIAPEAYERQSDSTVLFCQRRYFSIVARLCLEVVATSDRDHLPTETPLLTYVLVPGLALAEDSGAGFGWSRCRMLAEALWNAHDQGRDATVGGQLEEIRRHFARYGVALGRPHLNPCSAGLYDLPCTEEGP